VHNILDQKNLTLGAGTTVEQEFANSRAFQNVILQANASDDRTILVPKGAVIHMMPVVFEGLENIVIDINGAIIASDNWKSWPHDTGAFSDEEGYQFHGHYHHFMQFTNCNGLTFQSSQKTGKIDGQGYMWWVREFL
jgi:hypothetical protein